MADSPCTGCERGYTGRAFIAYINYYEADELRKCRLRLCQNCIADHFLTLVLGADHQNERGVWINSREYEQWLVDAHQSTMDHAQPAGEHSPSTSGPTPTPGAVTEQAWTTSAEHATSSSTKPRNSSSTRATKRG